MPCSGTVAVALVEGWEPSWFNVAEIAVLVWDEGVATVEGSPAKNEANIIKMYITVDRDIFAGKNISLVKFSRV